MISLEDSGVVSKHSSSAALTQKYIDSLSLDLLDDECVESAKVMATVYTAIAAFENMVRQFVVKILMENKGENWWTECVSDKIRKSADSRKAEEDTLILFIFCTHFIWSADLSCSVTPSFSAYSFTSREKRACASSSTSARWECSLPEVSRL